jgi:hypothetical protein
VQLTSRYFQYDLLSGQSFTPIPFYQGSKTAFQINDYWALAQQGIYSVSTRQSHDTVYIAYIDSGVTQVLDWKPTVLTTSNFIVTGSLQKIVLKFLPGTTDARAPDSLERAFGFRDATKEWDTTITF